jgi:lysophospholipase L1-like esterase
MKKFPVLLFTLLFLGAAFAPAQIYERAALWQKEIDAFREIDRRQTPPRDAVLFVGSSSFRKWETLRRDFPGVSVVNRGFGGSHIEDVNFYFETVVTPFRARKIFLYAGENDIAAGKTPQRVLADFVKFTALVKENSPGSKIYFVSLKPSPARWEWREKFRQTNALVKAEIEKIKGATFVDVWSPMLDAKGEPKAEIFIEDRLHLNEKGYEIWRVALSKYVK